MRYKSKAHQLLEAIASVQFASKYNISAFTRKTADTLEGSMKEPRRLFRQLLAAKLIAPIPVYGFGKQHSHNTFYRATRRGHTAIEGRQYRYIEPKSMNQIDHQSGLADIMLGFIYGYPEYAVEIDYGKTFEIGKNDRYTPDAYVKLTGLDGKEYHFIVEFERTREAVEIRREKLSRNEKITDFKRYGLPEKTKFLYVYAYERFNIFWRPVQYGDPEIKTMIKATADRFNNLIRLSQDLPDYKYRFMPFQEFYRLNEPVWITPQNKKVSLINN